MKFHAGNLFFLSKFAIFCRIFTIFFRSKNEESDDHKLKYISHVKTMEMIHFFFIFIEHQKKYMLAVNL